MDQGTSEIVIAALIALLLFGGRAARWSVKTIRALRQPRKPLANAVNADEADL